MDEMQMLRKLLACTTAELARNLRNRTRDRDIGSEQVYGWEHGFESIPPHVQKALEDIETDFRTHMAL